MISELTDEDILEYLMTSEFIENYRPEEYKYLLHKFKYFYRILHGNHTRIKGDKDLEIKNHKDSLESIRKDIERIQIENADLKNKIDLIPSERKLTIMERLTGKIKNIKNYE